ncbi:hypothetical protein MKW98_032308 [Papaver atlanticum]|uniref:Uncharacterized protein n=1 Tax=Papaver atlanticum TaxID=357466 RepID=A0AAD4SFY9_9MAGN|nr:hypothetical protein MKW98_032308 [Papaver atlanticum]
MDRELEKLQFLGFFEIYREAYHITASSKKIFSQIALAFILPLSLIYLAQFEISDLLFPKIMHNLRNLKYGVLELFWYHSISELANFLIFQVMYHIFLLVLSLLSTSAVAYTIACAYTTKEISFKKVTSVVPAIWKRLLITFLWAFLIMILYNFFAILYAMLILVLVGVALGRQSDGDGFHILFHINIVIYTSGLAYIGVIWHLASVVSVLEESYGYKAILKSKALIKGKTSIALVVFIELQISFMVVLSTFEILVTHGRIGVMGKVSLGIFCFLLLSFFIHFALVIQTVVYFVCKSYHQEHIDKSCLAEHLEAYDYVPLTEDRDIQLEEYEVMIESPP